MTTVRDLIDGHLRLIEELGAGQTATAEDSADALTSLVSMLDGWSVQNGMVYTETVETFTLTGNDGVYTIGPTGDFATVRPINLRFSTVQLSGINETPLKIISMEEYAYLPDKTSTGRPDYIYFDGNSPNATIRLHPIPSQAYTLTLYCEKPLGTYTSINDVVSLPPGYERAIKYNLAVERAPEYGKQASQTVISIAIDSYNKLMAKNNQNNTNVATVDDALLSMSNSNFNIYTR